MLCVGAYGALFAPPANFSPGATIRVEKGAALPEIAEKLAEVRVVARPFVLRAFLRFAGTSGRIQAGEYKFTEPENVFTIAKRLTSGDYGLPMARITFFEGTTIREMGEQVAAAFPGMASESFAAVAAGQEGYLFPDTYFFPPSADAASIVEMMRANFESHIAPLSGDIASSGHSLAEIITMASLLEREARTSIDRRMIAGILFNRIDKGMSLQVDAVFGYIFGRETYSPSYADLKVDSPYNTYTHKGLPPGPICNPGLDAIEAALNPTPSKYFYYLTGRDGTMHYAITYAAHQANQRKYLR